MKTVFTKNPFRILLGIILLVLFAPILLVLGFRILWDFFFMYLEKKFKEWVLKSYNFEHLDHEIGFINKRLYELYEKVDEIKKSLAI